MEKSKPETHDENPSAESTELQRTYAELPAPVETLEQLFSWLDEKLVETECDNTLRFTLEFAQANGLPGERLCDWMRQYHGYCDCEVLWNVRDTNPVFKAKP